MSRLGNRDDLARFIAAVRTRLHVNRLETAATRGAWITALALLVLGGIHTGLADVPVRLWLGTAGLLFVLAVAPALLARPSLAEAARSADRLFGGRGLFTTSVGARSKPGNRAAFAIVTEQAQRLAARCSGSLPERLPGPSGSHAALAAAPLFAAVVLLLQPGAQATRPATQTAAGAVNGVLQVSDSDQAGHAADVALLREQLALPALSEPDDARLAPAPAAQTAIETDGDLRTRDAAGDPGVDVAAATPGDDAGLASGRNAGEQALPATKLVTVTAFDVDATGESRAATPATQRDFEQTADPGAAEAIHTIPADPPLAGGLRATFTRAQAAYATRYLAATGNDDD